MSAHVGLSNATRLPVRPVAIVIPVSASARQAETLLADLTASDHRDYLTASHDIAPEHTQHLLSLQLKSRVHTASFLHYQSYFLCLAREPSKCSHHTHLSPTV